MFCRIYLDISNIRLGSLAFLDSYRRTTRVREFPYGLCVLGVSFLLYGIQRFLWCRPISMPSGSIYSISCGQRYISHP